MKKILIAITFLISNNLFCQFINPINSLSNRDFTKNYKVENISFIILDANEVYTTTVPENSFLVTSGRWTAAGAIHFSINGSNFFGSPEELIFPPNYVVSFKSSSNNIPFSFSLIEYKAADDSNDIINYAGLENFVFIDNIGEDYTIPVGFYLELILDYHNAGIIVDGQSISSVSVGTVIPENFTIQRQSSTIEFRDRPV